MEIASVAWSPDDRQLAFLGNDFPRGFASHNHLWLIGASGGSPTRLDDLDRSLQNGLNSDVRLGGVNSDPKWVGDRIYHLVAEGGSVHLRAQRVRDRKAETIVGGNRSVEAFQVNAKGIVFTAMEMAVPAELYTMDRGVRQLTEFNGEPGRSWRSGSPRRSPSKRAMARRLMRGSSGPPRRGRCRRSSTCTVGRRPLSATATSMNSRCSRRRAMRCSSPTREAATATRKTSRTSGATMASEITSISWRRWTSPPRSIRLSTRNASRSRAARTADS